jgi:hypothetical protein
MMIPIIGENLHFETQIKLMKVQIRIRDGRRTWLIIAIDSPQNTFKKKENISKNANMLSMILSVGERRHFETQSKVIKVKIRFLRWLENLNYSHFDPP